jgi:hypothetical protein
MVRAFFLRIERASGRHLNELLSKGRLRKSAPCIKMPLDMLAPRWQTASRRNAWFYEALSIIPQKIKSHKYELSVIP